MAIAAPIPGRKWPALRKLLLAIDNHTNSILNRLVQLTALHATGAIHVRIVRVHRAAFGATENAVLALAGFESPLAKFAVNDCGAERAKQYHQVSEDEL